MIVALSLFQGGGYRRVMGGEISVKEWFSRASATIAALPSLAASSNQLGRHPA
jgi:hypothetical protein